MLAEATPTLTWVLRGQRRATGLWALALAAVSGMYVSIYPVMGGEEMAAMTEDLPEAMIQAFGYDEIGTAGGYIGSSVYGLIGPVLLLVFGIGAGARLIAGNEQSGTLELELTGPSSRRSIYLQRLEALWIQATSLVAVVAVVTGALTIALDLDMALADLAAGSLGLLLLALAFATLSFAVGAATGRRATALAVTAAVGVVGFMLDAIGPTIDAGWMTAVSPFSWYASPNPLLHGVDAAGFAGLALLAALAAIGGLLRFERRDLMT